MSRSLPLLLALAIGCNQAQRTPGAFDTPSALAVLEEGNGTFTEPVGYAANLDGGRIAVMALTSESFLADDPDSVLSRSSGLATGEGRRIGELAVYAPAAGEVTLFAADKAYGTLLRVPHVSGLDASGAPIETDATISTPVFIDTDDSGDSPTLSDIVVYQGAAATEDWVVQYDGSDWWMQGSRSGRLSVPVTPGEAYTWDRATDLDGARHKPPVSFVLDGTATAGDEFRFSTDNGLTEIDVGGTPLHLAMAPDMSALAVVTSAGGLTRLKLVDPADGTVSTVVDMPGDASPGRLAWSPSGTLYAADNLRSSFWSVDANGAATEHVLPWPVIDVAYLESTAGENLVYLVPTAATSVWLYDLDAGELRDANAWMPGVQGIQTQAQVRGIGAIHTPFTWPEEDDDGVALSGKAVAVSLSNGYVQMVEESTGCFVRSFGGPRTQVVSQISGGDIETNFGSVPGAAAMQGNGTNGRVVQVNPCGGIAWGETWRVRYDQARQAWTVEGTLSGLQEAVAYEGERYVSDRGQISFLILSGSTPSVDGWQFTFQVRDGLHRADGDNDLDGRVDIPLDLPGRPIGYKATPPANLTEEWEEGVDRAFILVAAESADLVGRIDARYGDVVPWW
ncbi:MAG: hypothetical protein EP330_10995 [Deltaproteobacteria bacterium]|nr:MAG: hypothetical protein EP330_10995 [Deltaproteobacteria bacterium]